ncbi:LIM/homeobox protein Lhx2 [Amia ocellicauda]|uniref:LIM/homeobox protein Lhx2 n=1 Tax=Amia ocellicauda TaxID=2972642 RepID=UPI0034645C09
MLLGGHHDDAIGGVETPREEGAESNPPRISQSPPTQTCPAGGVLCAGCGGRVSDRFVLLAAGGAWHGACLRCSVCREELGGQLTLYCKNSALYCREDYCRLFSVGRCARCAQPIPSSALVMRSGPLTFHPHCFTCQVCGVVLLPGDLYSLKGRSLYCQSHYHSNRPRPRRLRHRDRGRETETDGERDRDRGASAEGEEPESSPELGLAMTSESPAGGAGTRAKRIRTCFKSHQLRAMETYFAQKHNPDGRDWACLSQHTGLPKRVLQVWFQNARAKLRRSLSADDSQDSVTTETAAPSSLPSPSSPNSPLSTSTLTSTIDQSQLSLLTAPLQDPAPGSSSSCQSMVFLNSPPATADYATQNALGLSPPDFLSFELGESHSGGEGGDRDMGNGGYY